MHLFRNQKIYFKDNLQAATLRIYTIYKWRIRNNVCTFVTIFNLGNNIYSSHISSGPFMWHSNGYSVQEWITFSFFLSVIELVCLATFNILLFFSDANFFSQLRLLAYSPSQHSLPSDLLMNIQKILSNCQNGRSIPRLLHIAMELAGILFAIVRRMSLKEDAPLLDYFMFGRLTLA